MPDGQLAAALGKTGGEYNVHFATASLSDGDTYDTGMSRVRSATVNTRNNDAGTGGAVQLATVASVSSGTLTIDYATIDGTDGGSVQGIAETMDVMAVGGV